MHTSSSDPIAQLIEHQTINLGARVQFPPKAKYFSCAFHPGLTQPFKIQTEAGTTSNIFFEYDKWNSSYRYSYCTPTSQVIH